MKLTRKEAADLCRILSDESRIKLLELLLDGEMNYSALTKHFTLNRTTLCYHISVLVEAGLILRRKTGLNTNYSISPEAYAFVSDCLKFLIGVEKAEK